MAQFLELLHVVALSNVQQECAHLVAEDLANVDARRGRHAGEAAALRLVLPFPRDVKQPPRLKRLRARGLVRVGGGEARQEERSSGGTRYRAVIAVPGWC